MISVFPDVIFARASLSAANLVNVTQGAPPKKLSLFPVRSDREAYHGYYDLGGSAFQSEPGAQFMKRSLWGGQSVYWNPYSATGAYGIETVVDIKTSPLSMAVALFGGRDVVFHGAYLAFSYLGVFCLLVLLTVELRLSLLSALIAGVTYLLNGYHVANLAANYAQIWLYFPVATLGLVSFAARPRVTAFLGIAAGSALILSTTFLPTTLITVGTVLLIGGAFALGFSVLRYDRWPQILSGAARIIGGQIAAMILALIVLAVLWLPLGEALRYMATNDYYANRHFYPAALIDFIALFTPKHAFESYNALTPRAAVLIGNVAFHQGIIGALLALQAVRAWPPFQRVVLTIMGVVLLLGIARVYGLPGLGAIADALPVIGHLGEQYLWVGIAILSVMVVPFGADAVLRNGVRLLPLFVGALIIVAALAYTTRVYGIESAVAINHISVVLLILSAAMLLLLNIHWRAAAPWLGAILLVLSWADLTFDENHVRLVRADLFTHPPPFVRFLQSQPGEPRVASYGYWGLPPEYGSAYGIRQVDSMNFHILPRYEDLFNRLILPDPADRRSGFITLGAARDTDHINLQAYDFVGTKYMIVPILYPRLRAFMERSGWTRAYEDAYFVIFENPHPPMRAFVTHRLVQNPQTPLDLGQSADDVATTDDTDLIERARALGVSNADRPGANAGYEPATITKYDHAELVIDVTLRTPGILVVRDAWHPNWRVSVDGRNDHLGAADEAFRGVALSAGRHVVEMTYSPRTLTAARVLTLLGLTVAIGMFVMRRRLDQVFSRWFAGPGYLTAGPPGCTA